MRKETLHLVKGKKKNSHQATLKKRQKYHDFNKRAIVWLILFVVKYWESV